MTETLISGDATPPARAWPNKPKTPARAALAGAAGYAARKKAMKESTKAMLNQIDDTHDWIVGQTYSSGGTEYHSTDTCHVCGLRRHYKSDVQNNIEAHYRFSDGETGNDLTIRQALQRGCA